MPLRHKPSAGKVPARCPYRPMTATRSRSAGWPAALALGVLALFACGASAQDQGQSPTADQGAENPYAPPANGTANSVSQYAGAATGEDNAAAGEVTATPGGQGASV